MAKSRKKTKTNLASLIVVLALAYFFVELPLLKRKLAVDYTSRMSSPNPIVACEQRENYCTRNVPAEKLYCDCGEKDRAIILGIHDDWLLWLLCKSPSCGKTWYICNQCHNSRTKIFTKAAMTRHYRDLHMKKRNKSLSKEPEKRRRIDEDACQISENGDDALFCPPSDCEEYHESYNSKDQELMDSTTENDGSCNNRYGVPNISWVDVRNPKNLGFANVQSQSYFENCHKADDAEWGGVRYLVRRSISQCYYEEAEMTKINIPLEHCDLHMKITRLCFLLSKKEWPLLTDVLDSVWQLGCEDGHTAATRQINKEMNLLYEQDELDITPNFVQERLSCQYVPGCVKRSPGQWGIIIPSTTNDLRKYYMEGKHSVLQNLPCPPISGSIKGHSYVSIVDCIRDFLGHTGTGKIAALDLESEMTFPNNGFVSDTADSRHVAIVVERACQKFTIPNNKPLVLLLFFWSDDFEPNSMSKSMRGSAWIKTMTILSRKENGQSATHTYPIALGKKNDSHEEVEAAINREMALVQDGKIGPFYDGRNRKLVHLFFDVHATLQDQPERRGANGVANGNSKFNARWGVSGDHAQIYDVLKCCQACLKTLEQRAFERQTGLPLPTCNHCLCWDILSPSMLAKSSLPPDYPITLDEENTRLVRVGDSMYWKPFRITYDGLRSAIVTAHKKFLDDDWSAANCSAFLKVEGMNDSVIKTFLDHAMNEACLDAVLSDTQRQIVEQERARNPRIFQRMPFLELWQRPDIELCTHPDVIMHLAFLGMVKTGVFTVKKWLTCLGKNQGFVTTNGPLLGRFKELSLDWLRIQPFTGKKLGGWVSENYLAFSRVMLWFYQNIEEAAVIVDNEPPDNLPQAKWLVKHNKHWLRVRGLDHQGLAAALSKRVAEYMASDVVPQEISQPERKVEDVEKALVAMTRLLQCVMCDSITDEKIMETEYCVRIFLSHFSKLSDSTWTPGDKKQEPKVITSYNLICLMNLPDAMRKYGPMRDLWEGSFRGEGFLRQTKPQMMQGFKPNWHVNLHRNILQEKAFHNIDQSCHPPVPPAKQTIISKNRRNLHSYRSTYEVQDILLENDCKKKRPICGVVVKSEHFPAKLYVKIGESDNVVQLCLENDSTIDNNHVTKFGLTYFPFKMERIDESIHWEIEVEPRLGDRPDYVFTVLLPLLENDNSDASRRFAVVSSNWINLEPNKTLDSLFQNVITI